MKAPVSSDGLGCGSAEASLASSPNRDRARQLDLTSPTRANNIDTTTNIFPLTLSLLSPSLSPTMTTQVANQDQITGVYQAKDAIGATIKAAGVTGAAGTFISAIQSTLTRQNVGAMAFLTRTGGTVALFGMN